MEHPPNWLPAANEVWVRGQWLPWLVGEHPALQFCNTFTGWGQESLPGAEGLRSYPALAVWTSYANLVEQPAVDRLMKAAQTDPGQADDVLNEARQLRTAIYGCFTDPEDQGAFERVAQYAQDAAKVSVFVRGGDGRGRRRVEEASAGLRLALHVVAWAAADLSADHRRLTVRTCANPACGRLLLDNSRIPRLCNAGTCGVRMMSSARSAEATPASKLASATSSRTETSPGAS